ncbi:hypothetical protein LG315_10135 [Microbacterium marinum]|uniref:hypothetical protein n=1 Tax=Microbacterium marinum TaxID=421115 RepID=UPI00384EE589
MTDVPRTRRERQLIDAAPTAKSRPPEAPLPTPLPVAEPAPASPAAFTTGAGTTTDVVDAATGMSAFAPSGLRSVGTDAPAVPSGSGPLRPLRRYGDGLPELEDAPQRRRPLWRHPASLVSMGTTLVAVIVAVVLLLTGFFTPRGAASALALEPADNAVRVSWQGPDTPYQLIVVGGPAGDEIDVSQLVTGREAWIPRAAGLIDDTSCVLVRPVEDNEDVPVVVDRVGVEAQGGAIACVADALAAAEAEEEEADAG